jgi:hypothetical protein
MTKPTLILVVTSSLLASASARAQGQAPAPAPGAGPDAVPTSPLQPPGPPPKETPPPPAAGIPAPPHAQPIEPPRAAPPPQPAAPAPAQPPGQWVYTHQYGWLWIPHAQQYTYVVPSAALAYEYVYYPTFGWRWVVAPWVLGFGVAPYWGALGPSPFIWYTRPWFRVTIPYYPYRGPGWRHPPAGGHGLRVHPHLR